MSGRFTGADQMLALHRALEFDPFMPQQLRGIICAYLKNRACTTIAIAEETLAAASTVVPATGDTLLYFAQDRFTRSVETAKYDAESVRRRLLGFRGAIQLYLESFDPLR
jgi:hypothetical protein